MMQRFKPSLRGNSSVTPYNISFLESLMESLFLFFYFFFITEILEVNVYAQTK